MRRATLLVAALLVLIVGGGAAPRIWSDASGKNRIRAEFVQLARGVVTLKRSKDASLVQIPLSTLRQTDREYAEEQHWSMMSVRVREAKKKFRPRVTVPAPLLAAYPSVRHELGLLSANGEADPRDLALQTIVHEWQSDPASESITWTTESSTDSRQSSSRQGNKTSPRVRIADRIELAFQVADALEPRLLEILSAFQQRQLLEIQSRQLVPLLTDPPLLHYLTFPSVEEELELDDDQRRTVADLVRGKLVARIARGSASSLSTESFAETEIAARLAEILSETQRRRLDQIRLHTDPSTHIVKRNLFARLKFSTEQKKQYEIQHESMVKEAFETFVSGSKSSQAASPELIVRTLSERSHSLASSLLPESQQGTWDSLVGESFSLWGSDSPFDPPVRSAELGVGSGE